MTQFWDWYKEPVILECKKNILKGLSKALELGCIVQEIWYWCFKIPDACLFVKVKNFCKYVANEINEWSRSIVEYLRGFLDDYATRRMQEEEIAGFWQLNQALVMQVSLSSRFLPTYEDKILKEFFRLHSELSFLNHRILTLLKFNKIEPIKDIKVILKSFRLKRICFGKPVPLTWGLEQIYCSANSVTTFIALSAS